MNTMCPFFCFCFKSGPADPGVTELTQHGLIIRGLSQQSVQDFCWGGEGEQQTSGCVYGSTPVRPLQPPPHARTHHHMHARTHQHIQTSHPHSSMNTPPTTPHQHHQRSPVPIAYRWCAN